MENDIFTKVEQWHIDGLPMSGLTVADRLEVIESSLGSFLAEHVNLSESELQAMDDQSLIAAHYDAMVERDQAKADATPAVMLAANTLSAPVLEIKRLSI